MLKKCIKQALKIQESDGNASHDALSKYEEGINAWREDVDDDYDFLYANYQAMWINSQLRNPEKGLHYAKKCMELIDPILRAGAIFHFTDRGNFYEEVIRYATNSIAWYAYINADNTRELEDALETISLGCKYADNPDYFYAFDTKVRLLLKLDRKEEAFRIVLNCLQEAPGFSDFDDIKNTKEYVGWKRQLTSAESNYSEEEIAFLQKAARITAKLQEQIAAAKEDITQGETFPIEKEIILIKEAKEKYAIAGGYYESNDCLLHYKGDLHIKGDLDNEWFEKQRQDVRWENDLYGMLVEGSLIVDGDVNVDMPVLTVTQDIICDYLYSGDGHTLISGNAKVKYGIYGHYNDGCLTVSGKLITPYIVADDHDMPRKSAEGEYIYIEGGDYAEMDSVAIGKSADSGLGWGWDYFADSSRLFSYAVFMEDEGNMVFSVSDFFHLVKSGKNPFNVIK